MEKVLNDRHELAQYDSWPCFVVAYASHPLLNKLFRFEENNRLNHLKE